MASIIGNIIGTSVGFGTASGLSSVLSPIFELAQYKMNAHFQHKIFQMNELALMVTRGIITENDYYKMATENGFDGIKAQAFLIATRQMVTASEIIIRMRKGSIKKEEAQIEAAKIGFDVLTFDKIIDASLVQPTPQDMIRFLVREVFNPDIVKKFKQDADFPPEATAEFAKIGVPEKLVNQYWQAHWELPSINQVFEMYYRFHPDMEEVWSKELEGTGLKKEDLVTDQATVELLLKTQDVMPFWRPRQLGIAYQPLNRVDVRRMIRLRQLDYKQTLYQFRKLGFSPVDAQRMTWFSIIFESLPFWSDRIKDQSITIDEIKKELDEWQVPKNIQTDIIARELLPLTESQVKKYKDITQGYIEKAYKNSQIDRPKAVELLQNLKFTEENAKFIIDIWQFEISEVRKKAKDLSKAEILKLFEYDRITKASAIERLIFSGYSQQEAEDLTFIKEFEIARKAERGLTPEEKNLSKTDIQKLYEIGEFRRKEAIERLIKAGYDKEEAESLIAIVDARIAGKEQK